MGIFFFFVSFLEVFLVISSKGTRSERQRKLLVQLVSVHFLRQKAIIWTLKSSSWPQLQLPIGLCVGLLESQLSLPVILLGPPEDSDIVLSLKQIIFPQMD